MSGPPDPDLDEDTAQLLRLAGRRSALPEERLERLRASAHHEWRRALRRRRLRSRALAAALLATAATLAWVLVVPPERRQPPAVPRTAGVVDYVRGDVRELSSSTPADGVRLGRGARLRPGTVVVTHRGRASIIWHDGARVRLDESTRVHVDADALRLERGAVYVEAEPGGRAPSRLVVETALGTALHLGTRYEVRLGEVQLRVRVREGRVGLQRADQLHAVAAGEALSVQPEGTVARHPAPTHGPDWDWVTSAAPPFEMEGRSARVFLDWAAAEGGWTLHFAHPSAAERAARATLHGTVEGMSPRDALAVALPTCGLDHRLDGDRLVVRLAASR